ncbi:hypothetical protein [Novosphingobium sp. AP12]|uniref:hypothetical protein n=1 Tax=Novosphingobium sp. AP12 TaxID=1144305 RepID=UPI00027205A5|nr:hypothetical protein [Novosphingobium sp. AP12]EJL25781.1 hypothetical protein PMI02_03150 [Novosphingobium sp. AP12]
MPDLPPTEHHQVVEALVNCGLDRRGFFVTHEEDVDDDFVRIGERTAVSPEQFACIRKAAEGTILWFDDRATGDAYGAYVDSQMRPEMSRKAREELAQQGRLAALPEISRYASAADFAQALEGFCGVRPGQVLIRHGADAWEIKPALDAKGHVVDSGIEQMGCIFNALTAQTEDPSRYGFNFGFIGNEALAEPHAKD